MYVTLAVYIHTMYVYSYNVHTYSTYSETSLIRYYIIKDTSVPKIATVSLK